MLPGLKIFHVYTHPIHSWYPGLLWEYWQPNVRRKARKIYILLCLERTWERGSRLENSIYGNSNNNNNDDDDDDDDDDKLKLY